MAAVSRAGADALAVRLPAHLEGLDGLIIPGGESTTIGKLMRLYGLLEALRARRSDGLAIWGTCAGMILLAREIHGDEGGAAGANSLGLMDIVVRRNAFGRQLESFEQELDLPWIGGASFRGIFIRAPLIACVGQGVRVLARLQDGRIVAAEQAGLLVTAFHPELTPDDRVHDYFLTMAARNRHRMPPAIAPELHPTASPPSRS